MGQLRTEFPGEKANSSITVNFPNGLFSDLLNFRTPNEYFNYSGEYHEHWTWWGLLNCIWHNNDAEIHL